jgi:hypothetical protein
MRRRTSLLVPLAAAAAVTGCGSGTEQIHKGEVQSQTQAYFDALARANGKESFPDIKCPDDLPAKKGQSTRCSARARGGTLGITVTITQVRSDGVTLRFKADRRLTN